MSLKNDRRRPVPDWLAQISLSVPNDLQKHNLPLDKMLENSLFYPACELDGRPIQFLAGFIHSFIYVDYGVDRDEVFSAMRDIGFFGYLMVGRKVLSAADIDPTAWFPASGPNKFDFVGDLPRFERKRNEGFVKSAFADWYVFDRDLRFGEEHGPSRFSLLYICCDGISAYKELYRRRSIAPDVLAIIQPGTASGGNYTDFRDPRGWLAKTVFGGNVEHVPQYLVYGGRGFDYTEACWPEQYPEHVEWFQRVNGNGVWKLEDRSKKLR